MRNSPFSWTRRLTVIALSLWLAGCGAPVVATTVTPGTTPSATPTSATTPGATVTPGATSGGITSCAAQSSDPDCRPGPGIQDATLFIEPAAGETPVVQAIQNATKSIQLEIYLLTDHSVINALEDAANRGVATQVMLEGHPYGSGSVTPQETISALNAAGVTAQEANPIFTYTHAKFMVIDGQTAYISSGNFTKTALGGSSYGADRDYLVRDTNPAEVTELQTIFAADWHRQPPTLSDVNLIVSPVNSRPKLLALIASASKTLDLEEEEMGDPATVAALIAAAQRGVAVGVVVPPPSSGSPDADNETQLTGAGVKVTVVNDRGTGLPYIHAKIIIVDGALAYVGSVNVSSTSYDHNREVGVLIANPAVIAQLTTTFQQDFAS